MSKFLVEVRNRNYERIGVIEQYTVLDVIPRFSDVGTWSITLSADSPERPLLQVGHGVIIWVEGHATPVMSGPITRIRRDWSASAPGRGMVVYSGVSDESILWGRIVYPFPAGALNNQSDRDGGRQTAGSAIAYLVDKNAGPGAQLGRQVPSLAVLPSNSGPVVSWNSRFDVLGTKIQELALANGLGFRLLQTETEAIEFAVYEPRDRSGTAVFSVDQGNLTDFTYVLEAPTATRFVVAAQGEGRNRYLMGYNSESGSTELVNNHDPRIFYTNGSWAYSGGRALGDYMDDVHHTQSLGATATFTFRGTEISYITENQSDMGQVDVYLDGVHQTTVNCYTSGPRQAQVVMWRRTNLPLGTHTIKLVNKSANKYFLVDAFEVVSAPLVTNEWNWNALEEFVDRRDIPIAYRPSDRAIMNADTGAIATASELAAVSDAALEAAYEAAPKASLSLTPVDTDLLAYGRDYFLGDRVSVVVDGEHVTDVLREVRLTDSFTGGPVIRPVIGTQGATETPSLYRQARRIWQALKRLETRH
ncbi:hypothetical protein ACFV0L_10410 [Streptosporangium canum]|uniref:Gp37-like protein n=1 Tax=Streptosporangium canum TaxID=324952 RepID=UPI0036BE4800